MDVGIEGVLALMLQHQRWEEQTIGFRGLDLYIMNLILRALGKKVDMTYSRCLVM
jgi:hypothetical protein